MYLILTLMGPVHLIVAKCMCPSHYPPWDPEIRYAASKKIDKLGVINRVRESSLSAPQYTRGVML